MCSLKHSHLYGAAYRGMSGSIQLVVHAHKVSMSRLGVRVYALRLCAVGCASMRGVHTAFMYTYAHMVIACMCVQPCTRGCLTYVGVAQQGQKVRLPERGLSICLGCPIKRDLLQHIQLPVCIVAHL